MSKFMNFNFQEVNMDRENTEKLCRRFSILNEFQNKQPAQYAFQKLKNAFPDLQIEEVEYWYKQGTRGFEEVFRNTWYGIFWFLWTLEVVLERQTVCCHLAYDKG